MAEPFLRATIAGEKELMKLFEELPNALTEKVLQRAGAEALAPVIGEARSIVGRHSVDRGDLLANLIVSTRLSGRQRRLYRRKGLVMVYAGPTTPSAAHAHLIEFGTADRYTKAGAYKGRVVPEPFMRPAWDAKKDQVLKIMRAELWAEMLKAVRKLRKGADRGRIGRTIARQIMGRG